MKPYVVLARKYRPLRFEDLIGQNAMVQTLRNAFASGRIAQGYMLTGVRGTGKTTTARILARALNYEPGGPTVDMPTLGPHCAEIIESRHPDVLEMDAASNTSVDNMREIIESARYKPLVARTKVFIIDEVHMLSKSAFNALLKTLEEPPEHVKFIFATTEIRKVPVTVLSRCQRFDLRRVDVPELIAHFERIAAAEGAKAERDALALIARAAEGSVRDGLSLLDQAIAMGDGTVDLAGVRAMLGLADRGRIFDLLDALFAGQAGAALEAFGRLHHDGAEPAQLLTDLAEAVHAAARMKVVGEAGSDALSKEEQRRAGALAARLSIPLLARAWQMLVKGLEDVSRAPSPATAAEMVLIRLAYTADLPSPDEIIRTLGGGTTSGRARPERTAREGSAVASEGPTADHDASAASPDFTAPGEAEEGFEGLDDSRLEGEEVDAEGEDYARVASYADAVALAGSKRDARLKVHLEEHVSLVKFDAVAGAIDIFLMPGAPAEIANELREKLNRWTGRRWVVMLSKARGEPPIGVVRREQQAAEIEQLKADPAVRALLETFPDAKIAEVRQIAGAREDDTGTG
ncbi:MAG: DNA polymerase III subunit gamma/tau [Pseudomonadota bacterium]